MKYLVLLMASLSSTAWCFDHNHDVYRDVLSAFVVRNDHQTLVNYKDLKANTKT